MINVSANKLKALLVAANITQRELARRSKIDPSRVSRLLKNGGGIRSTTAFRMATALGKTPQIFLASVEPSTESFFD